MRSQSSTRPMRDVDIDAPSYHSSDSGNFRRNEEGEIQMIMSSSSKKPDICQEEEDDQEQVQPRPPPKQQLPLLVFVWQFMTRATLYLFLLLNDNDVHSDTPFLLFLLATVLTLLNMLLLSVLKARKFNNIACVFAVFGAAESTVLVFLPDFLNLTVTSLLGVWIMCAIASFNPCAACYHRCKKTRNNETEVLFLRRTVKKSCWERQLYMRMIWFLFLSIMCEVSNLLYFWFLMRAFEYETDARKQRIVLCCITLKLLFTTYSRHMLLERKFSYVAMIGEFVFFATTVAIVYCYTFVDLDTDQRLILHYTFWSALGVEIVINFASFLHFSARTF